MNFFDFRIYDEYKDIENRAMKPVETSEELMEITKFVEYSRSFGMVKLNEKVKVCLFYLTELSLLII